MYTQTTAEENKRLHFLFLFHSSITVSTTKWVQHGTTWNQDTIYTQYTCYLIVPTNILYDMIFLHHSCSKRYLETVNRGRGAATEMVDFCNLHSTVNLLLSLKARRSFLRSNKENQDSRISTTKLKQMMDLGQETMYSQPHQHRKLCRIAADMQKLSRSTVRTRKHQCPGIKVPSPTP